MSDVSPDKGPEGTGDGSDFSSSVAKPIASEKMSRKGIMAMQGVDLQTANSGAKVDSDMAEPNPPEKVLGVEEKTVEAKVKEEQLERVLEVGKETLAFFEDAFAKNEEVYGFLKQRLEGEWSDRIPLTDKAVIDAVLNRKKGDVSNTSDPTALHVADKETQVGERNARFNVYSKDTNGRFVISVVAIDYSSGKSTITVKRGRTEAESFDAVTDPDTHTLTVHVKGFYGQDMLVQEAEMPSDVSETVIQRTTRSSGVMKSA